MIAFSPKKATVQYVRNGKTRTRNAFGFVGFSKGNAVETTLFREGYEPVTISAEEMEQRSQNRRNDIASSKSGETDRQEHYTFLASASLENVYFNGRFCGVLADKVYDFGYGDVEEGFFAFTSIESAIALEITREQVLAMARELGMIEPHNYPLEVITVHYLSAYDTLKAAACLDDNGMYRNTCEWSNEFNEAEIVGAILDKEK